MIGICTVTLTVDGIGAAIINDARPIVVGWIVGGGDVVAIDVIAGALAHKRRAGGVIRRGDRDLGDACLVNCAGSCLIVVVHDIDVATACTAVAAVAVAPVVHDAVAEIHNLGFNGAVVFCFVVTCPIVAGTTEAGDAILHVAEEVVVERCSLAAPDATVAVFSLRVSWVGQCFAHRAPLHGEMGVVVE